MEGFKSMDKAKILIVEDEKIQSMVLERIINDLGYHVCGMVTSGEEAIQMTTETKPDLIFMDIRIKGEMDGIEAAQKIREIYNIPIVYTTAHSDKQTLLRAKATGPFAYLIKPFEKKEIHATLELALYKHKMERMVEEKERWRSSVLNSIGDAVITTDMNGIITYMNPVAEKLTDCKSHRGIGRPLKNICHIIDEVKGQPIPFLATGLSSEYKIQEFLNHNLLVVKTGKKTPIDYRATPITDDKNHISGLVLDLRDITQQKQVEKEKSEIHK